MVNADEVITKSARETQELGEKLASDINKGAVLALYGDLGSGKTTFIQGLAKGFGIKQRVLSPTFVIMRQYRIANDKLKTTNHYFYHLDLYRIESDRDVEGLGLGEIMMDGDNLTAIEWPEKIANLLPRNRIEIYFEYLGEDERRIRIIKPKQV